MKAPTMKSSSALLFQAIIVLIGIGILGLMLWEPHLEGRNAHATTFQIYFKDPFLAYAYVGSIPFFMALHRAFGLFGRARRTGSFSAESLNALLAIKHCAFAFSAFVVGAALFILNLGDDRPAGIFMCLLMILAASAVATAAAMFARHLRNALCG